MSAEYYVRHRDRVRGPFTLEKLRELHDLGRLPDEVEIAEAGTDLFYPIASLTYLFVAPPVVEPRPVQAGDPAQAVTPLAARPVRQRSAGEEPEAAPRRTRAGEFTGALMCGILAVAALGAALLLQDWIWGEVPGSLPDGRSLRLRLELDLWRGRVHLLDDAGLPAASDLPVLGEAAGRWFDYQDLQVLIREGSEQNRLPGLGHTQLGQTRMLGLAMPILLGLGALLTISAAVTAQSRGTTPAGTAGGSVMAGVLGLACALGFLGLGAMRDILASAEYTLHAGVSYFLALGSAALIMLSGILLFMGASHARHSRPRRGRGGR